MTASVTIKFKKPEQEFVSSRGCLRKTTNFFIQKGTFPNEN